MALDFLSSRKSTTNNTNYQDSFNRVVTTNTGFSDTGNIKIELPAAKSGFEMKDLVPLIVMVGLAILAFREFRR